jgi:hypothetical protein
MHVVTVAHKDMSWVMCYGPFETMFEANDFARGKMKNHRLRVISMIVCDPDE